MIVKENHSNYYAFPTDAEQENCMENLRIGKKSDTGIFSITGLFHLLNVLHVSDNKYTKCIQTFTRYYKMVLEKCLHWHC